MTFRGCGDLRLASPRAYDAAKTEDLALAVACIHERFPQAPLFLVGWVTEKGWWWWWKEQRAGTQP